MTADSNQEIRQHTLRKQAEQQLKDGTVLPTHGWLSSLDALSLLHKLASSPESASDALKLLHELQVHQVELDLQHDQLQSNERELTEDLVHAARLYDFAPVSYLSVSPQGKIHRINVVGAAMCGEDRADLIGRSVEDFLAPESRPVLGKLVAEVRNGAIDESCTVWSRSGAAFHVKAGLIPGECSVLMVFVDVSDIVETACSA